ncbi:hypothetical protein [Rhizobium leguminosarum]|uniref:hypothetical protein n=1 Tax=Rhizobium leguminosarum TaxID=384 RepID=UPI0012BB581D|nr:hypothetical protein [Rhizobium leguminosarum]
MPALRRFPPLLIPEHSICLGFPNLIIILLFFSRDPKRATANLLMRGAQARPNRCQAHDLAIIFFSFAEIEAVDRRDQVPAFSSFPPPRQARRASGERLLT